MTEFICISSQERVSIRLNFSSAALQAAIYIFFRLRQRCISSSFRCSVFWTLWRRQYVQYAAVAGSDLYAEFERFSRWLSWSNFACSFRCSCIFCDNFSHITFDLQVVAAMILLQVYHKMLWAGHSHKLNAVLHRCRIFSARFVLTFTSILRGRKVLQLIPMIGSGIRFRSMQCLQIEQCHFSGSFGKPDGVIDTFPRKCGWWPGFLTIGGYMLLETDRSKLLHLTNIHDIKEERRWMLHRSELYQK